MSTMPKPVVEIVDELMTMPGVVTVVLGGSRALEANDEGSDWDLGVYYRGSIDLSRLAARGEVYPPGSWGRLMNGGAWLRGDGLKVDVLLRDLDVVAHWVRCAEQGEFEIDALLGYVAGVPTYLLSAELASRRLLRGELPSAPFPPKLMAMAPPKWRFCRSFSLDYANARGAAVSLSPPNQHACYDGSIRWRVGYKWRKMRPCPGAPSATMTKTSVSLTQNVKAAGCAAKLGPGDLAQILHNLPTFHHPDVIVGTETNDDAGVFRLRDDLAIVNTVDFFTPIVDDPFTFGQIAATNAISDIYAMGAEPRTALNIVGFPRGTMDIEILGEILRGGGEKARDAGVVVIGGHSIIDEEVKYGMAVTGEIHPDRVIRNVGVKAGDALVLTKPLGTGIITTALKQRKASQESYNAAVASMTTLNGQASKIMRSFAVHACSDVTGFALLGHSQEMAAGSEVTIVLASTSLPLLPGAMNLAEEGHLTGGCRRNRAYLQDKVVVEPSVRPGLVEIGFDPQTSGGLLIALPKADAPRLVAELHAGGVSAATIVGHATDHQGTKVRLV